MLRNMAIKTLWLAIGMVLGIPMALAAGYQVLETNASGLGNSFAGGAAAALDASSEFDNPASIVHLKNIEIDASVVDAIAHGNFTVDSLTLPYPGKNSVNPLGSNYLPALHLVAPLNDRFYFGFGMTVPFGYFTDYGDDSLSSNYATKSKIESINLNPSLAYKITDKLAVGFGFDAQYLKAEYNRNFYIANIPVLPKILVTLDTKLKNTATDWAYGWNAGLFYQFSEATRIGLAYRSAITHNATGNTDLDGNLILPRPLPQLPLSASWDLDAQVNLPETVLLSGYHDFNERFAMMASIGYTHWSRFDNLTMHLKNNTISNALDATIIIKEDFKDAFRYSLGGNYKFNDHWMWRVGAAYDQSPVTDANRTIPLPDGNRVWLSTGLQYIVNHYVTLDAGYAHLFIANGTVDKIDPISGHISGHFNHNYANLIGGQLSIKFG